jgi:uncharacterized protein YndB with AHSA1/START domain
MTIKDIELTFHLDVSPEEAFLLLTNPEHMADWGAGEGIVEPRKNGAFAMFDGWVSGKVLVFEPGKTLAYTWRPNTWTEGMKDSVVNYTFEKAGQGTDIRLTHTGFPSNSERDSHETGWTDHVFGPITEYLESR